MKVKVIPKEEFMCPFLGISTKDNLIVLFTERRKGVVLRSDNDIFHKQFSYREDWIDSSFIPFNGTITLSND